MTTAKEQLHPIGLKNLALAMIQRAMLEGSSTRKTYSKLNALKWLLDDGEKYAAAAGIPVEQSDLAAWIVEGQRRPKTKGPKPGQRIEKRKTARYG